MANRDDYRFTNEQITRMCERVQLPPGDIFHFNRVLLGRELLDAVPEVYNYHPHDLTGHDPYNSAADDNFMIRLVNRRQPEPFFPDTYEVAP